MQITRVLYFVRSTGTLKRRQSTYCAMEELAPTTEELPPTVPPTGISRERAEYLYKEIREFCRDGTEDFVAPPVSV